MLCNAFDEFLLLVYHRLIKWFVTKAIILKMSSISYSCIARNDVILVEKSIGPNVFQNQVQSILGELSMQGNRKTTLPCDK